MSGPTGASRILQIHPTRRCNLRCLHCYSSSGPEERGHLSLALLKAAVTDACAEGYTVVSLSGGEPLLYPSLRALLDHAHACGMHTCVTSNGMLLTPGRLASLQGAVDLWAFSLDGVPASHDQMRGSGRAFELLQSHLPAVRASGVPFGLIFTLTQHNLHELDWVATFARAQGARLLQIHPLEEVGRARHLLAGEEPDDTERAFAFLESLRLRSETEEGMRVQLDLVRPAQLRADPDSVFAGEMVGDGGDCPLADLVSPLVIEADATVTPLQYGFARSYALGSLQQAPLNALARAWRQECYPRFHSLCRQVFAELTSSPDLLFANWYAAVARQAERETEERASAGVSRLLPV